MTPEKEKAVFLLSGRHLWRLRCFLTGPSDGRVTREQTSAEQSLRVAICKVAQADLSPAVA